jgi:predicted small lipoprotein YifL
MLKLRQILVSPHTLAAFAVAAVFSLAACGQKGALYLPTEPAAARRATLPEILNPRSGDAPGAATPVLPAASAPVAR